MLAAARRARDLAAVAFALAVPAALLPATPAAAHHDDEPRTGDYEQVVDITYPTDPGKTSFSDSYAAARSGGRVHKASDLMGPKMTPLYAAVDGTVCSITGITAPMPAWGYSLTICAADGRQHRYIHINNDTPGTDDGLGGPEWAYAPGMQRGVAVRAGQLVGYMGDSGNAEGTAPHLHYEILAPDVTDPYGDHRINPYPSLRAALAAGRVVSTADAAPAVTTVARVSGADRVATAIAAAGAAWSQADVAVLAISTRPNDALVAGPLAGALGAPVLITAPTALDGRVAGELARLGARRVVLVGAAASIPGIDAALAHVGATVTERIAGASDPETAALVAGRVWAATPAAQRSATLALGEHADPNRAWPDALMAGWYGAVTATPVLLTAPGALPAATRSALSGIGSVTVVGGTAAVDEATEAAAEGLVGTVQRLSGPTRYDTALAVVDAVGTRAERSTLWVATGANWADAVTAAAAVARTGQALVLVDGRNTGGDQGSARWLWANAGTIRAARILGGDAAVNGAAVTRFIRRTS